MPVYRDIVVTDSCARDGKLCIFSSTEGRLNNKVDLLVVGGYSVAGGIARGREGGRREGNKGEYEYSTHTNTHTYIKS